MSKTILEQIATKITGDLESKKIIGVIILGEPGTHNITVSYHGEPRQVGILLGVAQTAIQNDIMKLGGYEEYIAGLLDGLAPVLKPIADALEDNDHETDR